MGAEAAFGAWNASQPPSPHLRRTSSPSPSSGGPSLRLPVSKLETAISGHSSPGVIKKLQHALALGSDLKGKALPSGLALTLNLEVSKNFTKGSFPLLPMDSPLTSGTTPLKEQ